MTVDPLKFEQCGRLPNGEKAYRLLIRGQVVREGLSLEDVIAAISRQEEAQLRETVTVRRQRHGDDPV